MLLVYLSILSGLAFKNSGLWSQGGRGFGCSVSGFGGLWIALNFTGSRVGDLAVQDVAKWHSWFCNTAA